jgi:hypothetical protein
VRDTAPKNELCVLYSSLGLGAAAAAAAAFAAAANVRVASATAANVRIDAACFRAAANMSAEEKKILSSPYRYEM